jgi:hypothetical protein
MTPSFDFIIDSDFRRSLESDYSEMERCLEAEAWKSVHVMAGSIVEALLIDYLAAVAHSKRATTDPLRLDLAQAIELCREEKVLTQKSADLSSAIRTFRNLIHPGRSKRLGEDPPTQATAIIARNLVDLITAEIAKVRQDKFGMRADQLLRKLEQDSASLGILDELLRDVHESEKERLLLSMIPERVRSMEDVDGIFGEPDLETTQRMKKAFRVILSSVSGQVRRRVAAAFVRMVREGGGEAIGAYRRAFFSPSDIEFIEERHRRVVIQHLLDAVPSHHTNETAAVYAQLGEYVTPPDVPKWIDPFVRSAAGPQSHVTNFDGIVRPFLVGLYPAPKEVDDAVLKRLDTWIATFEKRNQSAEVAATRRFREQVAPDLPF